VLVPGLAVSSAKYKYIFFQAKYTKAILSNKNRKLLWFEITKMLITVLKNKFIVIYYNFWQIFVFCTNQASAGCTVTPLVSPTPLRSRQTSKVA